MLKKMYKMTDNGIKAVYKASLLLALFELFCFSAIFPIMKALEAMFDNLSNFTTDGGFSAASVPSATTFTAFEILKYILIGVIILIFIYLSYRWMYSVKYTSVGKENQHLRMDVADKFRRLPQKYLLHRDLSDLTSAVMDDITTIEGVYANGLVDFLGGLFFALAALIILAFVNWKLTLCLAAVLPLAIGSVALSKIVSGKTHQKNRNLRLLFSERLQEFFDNIKILKFSNQIEDYQKDIFKTAKHLVPRLLLFEFLAGSCVSLAYNVLRLGLVFVIAEGAVLLANGSISPLVFLFFVLAAPRIYEPLSEATEYLGTVIASTVAAKRICEIVDYPEMAGEDGTDDIKNYDITFENVEFSYNQNDKHKVLDGVSFTAKQGEYTALCGPSGSGKSTICRLAARFFDIQSGKIFIGKKDISKINPEKLFSLFSIVFQDVTLFNDTIYNNILIGNKNATREQVLEAAHLAQCDSFIEKLPNGIETVIGENGHTLSGGERQRLSIARAFLKDAPIILLDESTASLDPETETKIQSAIEKLTQGKTVLMIAHRLRSIVNCDKILVLDGGKIIGNDTHDRLIENCAQYKKLYDLQTETANITLK